MADLEVNFDKNDLRAHDISVVVQAEKSAVKIIMTHDKEEAHFPNYSLSKNAKIRPMKRRENKDTLDSETCDYTSSNPNFVSSCDSEMN